MPEIQRIAHVSLLVASTEVALRFYRDLLGLEVDPNRPDLGYPGAWLKVAGQEIHLLELPDPDAVADRPEHGGRDRHVAFNVRGLDELCSRLSSARVPFTMSKSGRAAIFCRDPDGNALEFM